MTQIQNLHAVPIVVAAIAAWIFGAVYYGILGRKWIEAQGKTIEQCKAESAGKSTTVKVMPFVLSFIADDDGVGAVRHHVSYRHIYRARRGVLRLYVLARLCTDERSGQ